MVELQVVCTPIAVVFPDQWEENQHLFSGSESVSGLDSLCLRAILSESRWLALLQTTLRVL